MNQTRREFFRSLMQDVIATCENVRGSMHYSLDDLQSLSDSAIGVLTPCALDHVSIRARDGWLIAVCEGRDQNYPVCPINDEKAALLSSFDGHATLAEIADRISADLHRDREATFKAARDLFLALASQALYVPQQPGHD
jgi:hypothetical protein